MNPPATITTDLLTPLGAYLRLREEEAASFLLESVEQGRLGRHSFLGSGSRLVSFEEAESLGVPMMIGNVVRQMFQITAAEYGADEDFTNVVRPLERWAGVEVRSKKKPKAG